LEKKKEKWIINREISFSLSLSILKIFEEKVYFRALSLYIIF